MMGGGAGRRNSAQRGEGPDASGEQAVCVRGSGIARFRIGGSRVPRRLGAAPTNSVESGPSAPRPRIGHVGELGECAAPPVCGKLACLTGYGKSPETMRWTREHIYVCA